MQRKVLTDAAGVDGDAGVLADEVVLLVRDLDVLDDRVEDALSRNGRLAVARVRERVAQVLRDVLQRPDVEVRGSVFDCVLKLGGDIDAQWRPSFGQIAPLTVRRV
jgi:hypothetical protein